jgi:hypothetical protein
MDIVKKYEEPTPSPFGGEGAKNKINKFKKSSSLRPYRN